MSNPKNRKHLHLYIYQHKLADKILSACNEGLIDGGTSSVK